MNVFNVHVNRYPVTGVVKYVHYNKGKFFNAAAEKSSLENEQMSVGLEIRAATDSRPTDRRTHRTAHRHVQQGWRPGEAGRSNGNHPLRLTRRRLSSHRLQDPRKARRHHDSGRHRSRGATALMTPPETPRRHQAREINRPQTGCGHPAERIRRSPICSSASSRSWPRRAASSTRRR